MTISLQFQEVLSSHSAADQRSKVFALVHEFPYRTALELARKVNPEIISHEAIHKRLPELRTRMLVDNAMRRTCTVSGRQALTWTIRN